MNLFIDKIENESFDGILNLVEDIPIAFQTNKQESMEENLYLSFVTGNDSLLEISFSENSRKLKSITLVNYSHKDANLIEDIFIDEKLISNGTPVFNLNFFKSSTNYFDKYLRVDKFDILISSRDVVLQLRRKIEDIYSFLNLGNDCLLGVSKEREVLSIHFLDYKMD